MASQATPDDYRNLAPGKPGQGPPELLPLQSSTTTTTRPAARPAARGTAAYQRRRAVKACQVCRARRTKCDNLKPSCSFCLKVGATCIQSPVDLSSFDPASLKILERLDDLEQLMKSMAVEETAHKTRAVQAPPAESESIAGTGMIIPPGPEQLMTWPVFRGFQRGMDAEEPGADERYANEPAGSPMSVLGTFDLEPRRINDLLDNFFKYVHVKNPILDEATTRRVMISTAIGGIDWSPESCLCLLICALGSIATPFGPSFETMPGTAAHSSAQTFFQAAQRRLGVLLASDDLLASQCLFLSGVYMMCVFQPVKAWRYFVQALASCQQFGFFSHEAQQRYYGSIESNDEPQHYSKDTLQQAIYWSSWKSERELRSDLHLPDFSLSDKELAIYPPSFPSPPALRVDGDDMADPSVARERTSWYFYLSEISLRRLTARISSEIVSLNNQLPRQQDFLEAVGAVISRFEEQAQEWVASLPRCLSFDAPVEGDDVCRFVLRGHLLNLLELIYWPFFSAVLNSMGRNDAFQGLQLTPRVIELAQKGLDNHLLRLVVNRPGFRHRHHGTLPMMRTCSRSALMLVVTAKLNRPLTSSPTPHGKGTTVLALPQGWRQEVEEVISLLTFWEKEIQQLRQVRHFLEQSRDIVLE